MKKYIGLLPGVLIVVALLSIVAILESISLNNAPVKSTALSPSKTQMAETMASMSNRFESQLNALDHRLSVIEMAMSNRPSIVIPDHFSNPIGPMFMATGMIFKLDAQLSGGE